MMVHRKAKLPPGGLSGIVQDKLAAAAARYGVPVDLVFALAKQESGYSQSARSSEGAIGVMQLMPRTAQGLGVDPYDLDQNIDGGVRYLSQLHSRFGDWVTAAAAYNAGPGRVSNVLAGKATLPSETRSYIQILFGQGTTLPGLSEQVASIPPGTGTPGAPATGSPAPPAPGTREPDLVAGEQGGWEDLDMGGESEEGSADVSVLLIGGLLVGALLVALS